MSIFESPDYDAHERVVFVRDASTGLCAIIAVHDTTLGPSLGGCRMWPYASEALAIRDVLRLSRGMTYKAALARVPLGGGKSVVIGDSRTQKTPGMLQAMGRAIESLGGRYIVGEDIGTNPDDMRELRKETRYVSCLRKEDGGYGDPAPMTALGVFSAMRAAVVAVRRSDSLQGLRIAVQGVGNVGRNLCALLHEAGAALTVCDVYGPNALRAAEEFDAAVVEPEAIYSVQADIFAPCAMGGIVNADTISRLRASIIAGAANNQLADDGCGELLRQRSILYMPDYVANGGGLVSCAAEWYRYDPATVRERVLGIFDTCNEVIERARASGMTTNVAADAIARERIEAAAVRQTAA